jgi:hypothetical protein
VALDRAIDELRRAGQRHLLSASEVHSATTSGGHHVKIQVSDQGEAILAAATSRSSFEGWNEYAMAVRGCQCCSSLRPLAHGIR